MTSGLRLGRADRDLLSTHMSRPPSSPTRNGARADRRRAQIPALPWARQQPDGWLTRTHDDPWLDLKRPPLRLHQFGARYDHARWGQPFQHATGHSVVEAAVLRFEIDEALAQTKGGAVLRALRPWFRVVRNWISAMTGQDLDANGKPFHYIRSGTEYVQLWGFGSDGKSFTVRDPDPTLLITQPIDVIVTRKVWQKAVELASAEQDVPIEHLLLNEARAAGARGKWRQLVLEAATAAEVALSAALRARLAPANEAPVIDAMMARKTLGALVQLCDRLGVLLPPDTQLALVKPRNDAIHAAVTPTPEVASKAFTIATSIICSHRPLP
jgi:hypothetical protein